MLLLRVVALSTLLSVSWCVKVSFPPGFRFGAATAAFQVEGAWNVSDKAESIWDKLCHDRPELVYNGNNGDVACDSYHQWERDIELATELGLHFYRFSLSWPRLLPNAFTNYISEDGKKYYNNLIDGLLEKGIQPVVTIYHWDLPQNLQDLGGWTNPLITDWFADYARVVFSLFGDRVKTWLTINEPLIICDMPYNFGLMAPGIYYPEVATYLCNKYTLIAHAKAWRVYDDDFRAKYHGEVSLANHLLWAEALTPDDEALAELVREDLTGRYSHPIFSKEGGWPASVEKKLAEISKLRGYPKSTLPAFTSEEIKLVRGTYDFYAVNHYTSRLVRKPEPNEQLNPAPFGDSLDMDAILVPHPDWNPTVASWFYVYPEGIRKQLGWLRKQYGDIKIMITENGYTNLGGLDDDDRVKYYRDYLEQVLLAINEDGINVTAYTAWTLIDNFEWNDGYRSKFGLYEVDFSDPQRTRRPRKSAHYYATIIKDHALDLPMKHAAEEL